jgi:hypothetical protein
VPVAFAQRLLSCSIGRGQTIFLCEELNFVILPVHKQSAGTASFPEWSSALTWHDSHPKILVLALRQQQRTYSWLLFIKATGRLQGVCPCWSEAAKLANTTKQM